jgi:hypothetical protein
VEPLLKPVVVAVDSAQLSVGSRLLEMLVAVARSMSPIGLLALGKPVVGCFQFQR